MRTETERVYRALAIESARDELPGLDTDEVLELEYETVDTLHEIASDFWSLSLEAWGDEAEL